MGGEFTGACLLPLAAVREYLAGTSLAHYPDNVRGQSGSRPIGRCAMDLRLIAVDQCRLPQKKVIEGLCLSYDMLRELCLETMGPCPGPSENPDRETGP